MRHFTGYLLVSLALACSSQGETSSDHKASEGGSWQRDPQAFLQTRIGRTLRVYASAFAGLSFNGQTGQLITQHAALLGDADTRVRLCVAAAMAEWSTSDKLAEINDTRDRQNRMLATLEAASAKPVLEGEQLEALRAFFHITPKPFTTRDISLHSLFFDYASLCAPTQAPPAQSPPLVTRKPVVSTQEQREALSKSVDARVQEQLGPTGFAGDFFEAYANSLQDPSWFLGALPAEYAVIEALPTVTLAYRSYFAPLHQIAVCDAVELLATHASGEVITLNPSTDEVGFPQQGIAVTDAQVMSIGEDFHSLHGLDKLVAYLGAPTNTAEVARADYVALFRLDSSRLGGQTDAVARFDTVAPPSLHSAEVNISALVTPAPTRLPLIITFSDLTLPHHAYCPSAAAKLREHGLRSDIVATRF